MPQVGTALRAVADRISAGSESRTPEAEPQAPDLTLNRTCMAPAALAPEPGLAAREDYAGRFGRRDQARVPP